MFQWRNRIVIPNLSQLPFLPGALVMCQKDAECEARLEGAILASSALFAQNYISQYHMYSAIRQGFPLSRMSTNQSVEIRL